MPPRTTSYISALNGIYNSGRDEAKHKTLVCMWHNKTWLLGLSMKHAGPKCWNSFWKISQSTNSWQTYEESCLSELHKLLIYYYFFFTKKISCLWKAKSKVKFRHNPAKQMSSNADIANCFWTAGSYHMAEIVFPDFNPQLTCFLHVTHSAGKDVSCYELWSVKWSSSITVHLMWLAYYVSGRILYLELLDGTAWSSLEKDNWAQINEMEEIES